MFRISLYTLLIFSFFSTPVFAQQNPNQQFTDAQCENDIASGGQGGICKRISPIGDGCDSDQTRVGLCDDGTFGWNFACCVPNSGPGITEDTCEKAPSVGGLGGVCLVGCTPAQAGPGAVSKATCGENILGQDLFCCVSQATIDEAEATSGVSAVGNINVGTYYTPLENLPLVTGTSFQSYLEGLYSLALILVVLSAVFMLVVGGFMYITSAGNTAALSSAKHIIQGALFGLVLALVAWLLLTIINPDLVNLKIGTLTPSSNNAGSGVAGGGAGNNCATIPASDLVTIDGFQMLKSTGDNFRSMQAAAKTAGIDLVLSSGYRSPARQMEIWNEFGCSISGGKTVCPGGKLVAVPCALGGSGSNHSSGHAIDIQVGCGNGTGGCNTKTYQWLKTNGGKYNFFNNIPTDPPHWSATGK